jgi:Protein of unknown function (DUF2924)
MDATIQQQIESLRKLKMKELKRRYLELFGEESRSSNHQHLFRRIAWRLQARAEGDLSQRARERASELAEDVDLRLRAPRHFWKQLAAAGASRPERDPRLPAVGIVLTRSYQGRTITVTVLEDGFQCDGRTYRSLSAIAHHVTGTRWNGLLFFGLIQRQERV